MLRTRFKIPVLALAQLLALPAVVCAQGSCLYGFSTPEATLYRIDIAEGGTAVGPIAPVAPDADLAMLTDAGVSVSGERLAYTIDRRANVLHTVRLADAVVVASVALDADVWVTRRGLVVSPGGRLFGLLPGLELRTIDPATGATTLVGAITGATIIEAIAFSPDGVLYAVGKTSASGVRTLFTIDPTTAAATVLFRLPPGDLDTLAFAGDGMLYASDADGSVEADLIRIDPATGDLEVLENTGIVGLNGLTAVPCPCPPDLDGDGVLTIFDFLAYAILFDLGSPTADFDGDGELTIFDFLAFQTAFDAGCA